MSDKPSPIFVQWPHVTGTGLAFTCQARPPAFRTEYITRAQADAEIAAAVAAEREACAKGCDKIAGNTADFGRDIRRAAGMCAAAIRERGNK